MKYIDTAGRPKACVDTHFATSIMLSTKYSKYSNLASRRCKAMRKPPSLYTTSYISGSSSNSHLMDHIPLSTYTPIHNLIAKLDIHLLERETIGTVINVSMLSLALDECG
jgi:hypothetical protein